jgi:hypothetical protein
MARVTPGGLKRRIKQLESEREGELKGSDERGRTNRRLERERQRYDEATGWVHGGAGRHAETNECLVICGHTHKPWKADGFEGEKPVQRVHDDGDLVDSCTYLVIEGGTATLQRLEGKCKPEKSKPESSLDQVTRWALLAGLASALLGLVIALLPIPISVSTLLGRYPWLPGWIVWQATTFLAAGVALFAVGCVLDMVARRLGPTD